MVVDCIAITKNNTIEIIPWNGSWFFEGASKNCVVLDFCTLYCNPEITQGFQFLKNLKSQLENKILIVNLISDPYIEYPDYINSIENIKKYFFYLFLYLCNTTII